tara:strand:- start:151177 stop:151716 length:540 start_codon:yes stop_codon:yes gene_type:complete
MFDDILEAAARIIEEEELAAVNTNAVAEAAGVSIGSLYQYFPNLAAILAELTLRERGILMDNVNRVALEFDSAPLEETLLALIEVAVAHQLARPRLARTLDYLEDSLHLFDETVQIGDEIRAAVASLLRRYDYPLADQAAADLVALSKGMIDAAGRVGETDSKALSARVARATLGYLKY